MKQMKMIILAVIVCTMMISCGNKKNKTIEPTVNTSQETQDAQTETTAVSEPEETVQKNSDTDNARVIEDFIDVPKSENKDGNRNSVTDGNAQQNTSGNNQSQTSGESSDTEHPAPETISPESQPENANPVQGSTGSDENELDQRV